MIRLFKRHVVNENNELILDGIFALGNREADGAEVEVTIEESLYEELKKRIDNGKTSVELAKEEVVGEFLQDTESAKKKYSSNIPEWTIGVYYEPKTLVKKGEQIYIVSRPHTSTEAWVPGEPNGKDLYTLVGDLNMTEDEHPQWVEGIYPIGFRAWYEGKLYEVTQGDADGMNHWPPTEYGWEEVTE